MATIWGTLLVVGASTLVGWVIYKRQKQAAHDESLAATTRLLEARQRAVEVLKTTLPPKRWSCRWGRSAVLRKRAMGRFARCCRRC